MSRPTCMTCYYLGKDKTDEGEFPVCRRNAPVPVSEEDIEATVARWPMVEATYDWCGDHHPIGEAA